MYIDLALGESLLISVIILVVLLTVIAAIGWAGYIRLLAENEAMTSENNSLKYTIRKYRRRENIRTANEYSNGLGKSNGPET